MQYIKKIPIINKDLSNQLLSKGWKRLKEPSNLFISILISIPFMFINAIIFTAFLSYLYSPLKELLRSGQAPCFSFTINLFSLIHIIFIFAFMTLHEFIHAFFIPNGIKSEKTYWGINGFFAFVFTTEKIKKNRFIIISIMPFILLSVMLPIIAYSLDLLNGYIIVLCLINAMGSSVDILNICLIAFQVPNGSYIMNNGFETYFK